MSLKNLQTEVASIREVLQDMDGMDACVEIHEDRITTLEGEQTENVNAYRALLRRIDRKLKGIEKRLYRLENPND